MAGISGGGKFTRQPVQSTRILSDVVRQFCCLAGDITTQWEFQRRLSEHWDKNNTLKNARFGNFSPYMNGIIVDSWFLSVARLHDSACMQGHANVSVDFIVGHPQLDASTRVQLKQFVNPMDTFAAYIRKPRNKLLAHNDLTSNMSVGNLGAFPLGEDEKYIAHLRRFVGIVSIHICNEPFVYDSLSVNDVDAVVAVLAQWLRNL